MYEKKGRITKIIKHVFLLDSSKLSRLINIIEDKYRNSGMGIISNYDIILKNGKKLSTSNLEHIIEQDNTINNPIINLIIEIKNINNLDICSIEYNKIKSTINLSIDTVNLKWANELIAEIEEQTERSLSTSLIDKKKELYNFIVFILPFTIAMFLLFFVMLSSTSQTEKLRKTNYLSDSDIKTLNEISKNAKNIDDKINILFEIQKYQLNNILLKKESLWDILRKIDLKTYLLLLPFLIIFIIFIYLVNFCYPGSLFIWGDYEGYYNNLLNKRKIIWNGVVIALAVGIIGNLFVFGLSNLFRS